ncbi:MAG TPA: hypothetical protein VND45_10060 [Thermoanaerobaculia bacterium]|nr:hypothetical protein [Thermoanaerobaculia bacterium]
MNDLETMAQRTDRALRTSGARRTAESVYELMRSSIDPLETLSRQRGWSRRAERVFVCSFGGRTSTLDVPRVYDAETLARLITRIEVNVFLGGGADDLLLRELQAMAQRELQRLFEED